MVEPRCINLETSCGQQMTMAAYMRAEEEEMEVLKMDAGIDTFAYF